MLRMPPFEVHLPTTATEAVRLRTTLPDAMYVAGGTDLLPNLKHRLHAPQHLVGLTDVHGMADITLGEDGTLTIGALATLDTLANHETIRREVPGLAQAAGSVAGPQHRKMGTIGGNVMLDTRCLFYNQTQEWRQALGNCLKKDGDWCHVIGSKKACVAAQSSDTVPLLIALDARLEVRTTPEATEEVCLRDVFTKDGRFDRIHTLPHTALVESIQIPPRAAGHRSVYRKIRSRSAVDYPQLGVAISGSFDGLTCTSLDVVIGAMMPQPKRLKHMDKAVGQPLDDALIEDLATHGFKQVRPQTNIHGSPQWRRHMARVELVRGLKALRPSADSP
jgi:4-hydroxybenzoyl-CoA reductase subunit beta